MNNYLYALDLLVSGEPKSFVGRVDGFLLHQREFVDHIVEHWTSEIGCDQDDVSVVSADFIQTDIPLMVYDYSIIFSISPCGHPEYLSSGQVCTATTEDEALVAAVTHVSTKLGVPVYDVFVKSFLALQEDI